MKLQAKACNFTQSNTTPLGTFHVFNFTNDTKSREASHQAFKCRRERAHILHGVFLRHYQNNVNFQIYSYCGENNSGCVYRERFRGGENWSKKKIRGDRLAVNNILFYDRG